MASYAQLAKRLQSAINMRSIDTKLVISTQQWYSTDKKRPVTIYVISQATKDKGTIKLFKTYSQVQMCLWLRDYWYKVNDWEVPTDNPMWEEVKKQYES